MYTVECDGVLIHDQKSPDPDVHLISPQLSLQENAAGSFEFTMPLNNPGYSIIEKMLSIIAIKKDGNVIWTGRPISEHIDFYGRKKIVCEGALAYLNDTLQDPQEYLNKNVRYIFRAIIEAHNAKVDNKRKFSFGSITIQDLDDDYIYETNYSSTWETIRTSFIERLEGHVSIHYNGSSTTPYIDYTDTYNTTSQEINFGENLLDFSKDYDLSNLFTVIYPKGKEITKETTGSDAGDDRNPQTTTRSASANGITVGFNVVKSDLRVTVKITSISVSSSVAYKGEHNIKLVIGEETIVSRDASYTSTTVNGKTVKNYQTAKACADAAASTVTTKINNDTAKVTYTRAQEDSTESVVLNVFGKSTTLKVSIPKSDESSEYITGVEKREYTNIASVNNGSVYLENTTAVNKFGRIEREIEFNDIDSPKQLLNLARRYIQATQFDEMSLTVSAVDLHFLNSAIQSLGFLDQVRCISAVHGMDKVFPITEVTLPLDSPDQVTYTLGHSTSSTMTGKSVANSSNFSSAIRNVPSFANTLNSAKNDMTAILNRRTNGYINLVQENEVSQAIVISDTPDWANATKVWKWDINGLGYSDTTTEDANYDGPSAVADGRWYKMGITMDGTIVADVIKTGILEDGMGYNYWNLATGEFSLQPNYTMIGDNYSLSDLKEATQTADDKAVAAAQAAAGAATIAGNASTAANTANTKVDNMKNTFDMVETKEYGVANLLNGTYAPVIKAASEGGGTWSSSTWKSSSAGNGQKRVLDCNKQTLGVNPPNGWLTKCIQIQGSSNGKTADISQEEVPLTPGTVYTMSCYVLGTGVLHMAVGKEITVNNVTHKCIVGTNPSKMSVTNRTKWKRYSLVFTTNAENETNTKRAGLDNGVTNVFFGNSGVSSSSYLIIAGMKIEKGNTPTDWFPSIDDINNEAQEYTREFVEENVPKETEAQLKAYDKGLKGEAVLKKLTDGFKNVGIYAKKLSASDTKMSLLINADYIRSGMLDATIIRTGWIRDQKKNNEWNLKTGYFKTKQMHAENIVATGSFTTGDPQNEAMQMDSGIIHGYHNRKHVGSLGASSSIYNIDTRRVEYGLSLRGKQNIDIRSPSISVRNKNDTGISTTCYTGNFKFDSVRKIEDAGNGAIRWITDTHTISIINGLIVAIA